MSSNDIALSVRGLSKAYTISHAGDRPATLAEALLRRLRHPFQKVEKETFWALKEATFDVQRGEVVGVIGRNGAGKSTLLKVLSRITEPTDGQVDLYGRIGSLLEVGTGFHPELTGRENIFLNGAILGMPKPDIRRQFDAIVDFAGVEKFLDTPVKRYSSGMYVRLAFAVAAHLDSEILIVDEVLAVGDAEFQKKCLGKMKNVSASGRTVLFVSHNMNAVHSLCSSAIFLQAGKVVMQGSVSEVTQHYFGAIGSGSALDLASHPNRTRGLQPHFSRLELKDADGEPVEAIRAGETLSLAFGLEIARRVASPRLGVGITNAWGERVAAVANYLSVSDLGPLAEDCTVEGSFEVPPLIPGRYFLDISLNDQGGQFLDEIHAAAAFEIVESNHLGAAFPYFREMGHVLVPSSWQVLAGTASRQLADVQP